MHCPCEGESTNHTLVPVRHMLRPKKHLSIEHIMHHGAIRLQRSVRRDRRLFCSSKKEINDNYHDYHVSEVLCVDISVVRHMTTIQANI
jgi:hypothetical protein